MITPNWMSELPGWSYRGDDPDGFMTAAEVTRYLQDYRRSFGAPVQEGVEVLSVRSGAAGFQVRTTDGDWAARAIVDRHRRRRSTARPTGGRRAGAVRGPAAAPGLPTAAAATAGRGADRRGLGVAVSPWPTSSPRPVAGSSVSVGSHVWLPRQLAGRDIWWWLRESGWLGRTVDEVPDVDARPPRTAHPAVRSTRGRRRARRAVGPRGRAGGPVPRCGRHHDGLRGRPAADPRPRPQPFGGDPGARHTARRVEDDPATAGGRRAGGSDRPGSDWTARASGPFSGRQGTGRTTRGCTCPFSTRPGRSPSTADARWSRGSSSSARSSSTAATRRSWTACGTTPPLWSGSWWTGAARPRAPCSSTRDRLLSWPPRVALSRRSADAAPVDRRAPRRSAEAQADGVVVRQRVRADVAPWVGRRLRRRVRRPFDPDGGHQFDGGSLAGNECIPH